MAALRSIAPALASLAIVIGGGSASSWPGGGRSTSCSRPLVEMFYPMPKSALIPVTVIWLGFGDGSKILLIFLGCMLPVTIGAYNGARGERPGAGVVGAQHGRRAACACLWDVVVPSAHAGTAQRHPHRAGAVVHPAGHVRIDRGAHGLRLSDRRSRRQRRLRRDVCGGADGGVPRLRRRPHLSDHQQTGACDGASRRASDARRSCAGAGGACGWLGWSVRRRAGVVNVGAGVAWERLARSGAVTPSSCRH